MDHKFVIKIVLEEEVDGNRSEVMMTYDSRPASTVHNAPRRSLMAMADEAADSLVKMFLKSRRGGGR